MLCVNKKKTQDTVVYLSLTPSVAGSMALPMIISTLPRDPFAEGRRSCDRGFARPIEKRKPFPGSRHLSIFLLIMF